MPGLEHGTSGPQSPAFTTRAPVVLNAGLIPPEAEAHMRLAWDMRQVAARMVKVHELRDVFIAGEGLVFDRNLAVVPGSGTQHSPAEVEAGRQAVAVARAAGKLAPQAGRTLLCLKRGAGNYGHWLAEMLPLAFLWLGVLQAGTCWVLAPAPGGPLGQVVPESLDLMGVPAEQVRSAYGRPQWFEHLILAEGLTWHGTYLSPLVITALDWLARDVLPGPHRRVWVSRAGAIRTLAGEAGLCRMLATKGWTIAQPGGMRLRDQIGLFKGARQIAGVAGAGLANLAFARPPARVTAFVPANMCDTFFWLLSELRGHDYTDVRCALAGPATGISPWDGTLSLPLPSILSCLA